MQVNAKKRVITLSIFAVSILSAVTILFRPEKIIIHFYDEHEAISRDKLFFYNSAVQLFNKKSDNLLVVPQEEPDLDTHLTAVAKTLKNGRNDSIGFAPMGSDASEKLSALNLPQNILVMQPTADRNLSARYQTVSIFFSAANYMHGLTDLLLKIRAKPRRVHLLVGTSHHYFSSIATTVRKHLIQYHVNSIDEFMGRSEELSKHFEDLITQKKISNQDWIIFIDIDSMRWARGHNSNKDFVGAEKVFIYPHSPLQNSQPLANSTFIYFWLPQIRYPQSSEFTNCDFVKGFREEFSRWPDFHAAFLYAILQTTADFKRRNIKYDQLNQTTVKTILGSIRFSNNGERLDQWPFYIRLDEKFKPTLYTFDKNISFCDHSSLPVKFVDPTFQ
jgi:hypothetical protein